MSAFNDLNGVPTSGNKWLLTDILRGEWGFDGAIVSDYAAIGELASLHHIAPDMAAAARLALIAGAVLFGIGWGLAGFCPGPAVVSLGSGQDKAVVFTIAMLAGMALFEVLDQRT